MRCRRPSPPRPRPGAESSGPDKGSAALPREGRRGGSLDSSPRGVGRCPVRPDAASQTDSNSRRVPGARGSRPGDGQRPGPRPARRRLAALSPREAGPLAPPPRQPQPDPGTAQDPEAGRAPRQPVSSRRRAGKLSTRPRGAGAAERSPGSPEALGGESGRKPPGCVRRRLGQAGAAPPPGRLSRSMCLQGSDINFSS